MKPLNFISMLSLLVAQGHWTALAAEPRMREDIDQDIPLAEAVSRTNELFQESFGAPLSEQEYRR